MYYEKQPTPLAQLRRFAGLKLEEHMSRGAVISSLFGVAEGLSEVVMWYGEGESYRARRPVRLGGRTADVRIEVLNRTSGSDPEVDVVLSENEGKFRRGFDVRVPFENDLLEIQWGAQPYKQKNIFALYQNPSAGVMGHPHYPFVQEAGAEHENDAQDYMRILQMCTRMVIMTASQQKW